MMKAIVVALVLLFTTPTPAAEDNFLEQVVVFDKHWVLFLNELAGCSTPNAPCDPRQGHINYGEFAKAEKAARRLFHHEPAK